MPIVNNNRKILLEKARKNIGLSKGEMTELHEVSYTTWDNWTKKLSAKLGEYTGGKYTPAQMKILNRNIDLPDLDDE